MTARNGTVADRMRQVRVVFGVSQPEMAAKLGMTARPYQDYEAGKRLPGGEALQALADIGVNLNWLLTGDGQMLCAAPPAAAPALDEQLLAETLRVVDDWLAAHRRTMTAARKAEVAASIYAMALEDVAEGRPALDERRIAHILKLAG